MRMKRKYRLDKDNFLLIVTLYNSADELVSDNKYFYGCFAGTVAARIVGKFVYANFLQPQSPRAGIYLCTQTSDPNIFEFIDPLTECVVLASLNSMHIISNPAFEAFCEQEKLERFLEKLKTPEPIHSELSWPVYCAETYGG